MSIGGQYYPELELVLMLGAYLGLPVLFALLVIAIVVSRGTARYCSLGLLGAQIVIVLGAFSATPLTMQFWRWMLLLYLAVAPVFLVLLVLLGIRARKRIAPSFF